MPTNKRKIKSRTIRTSGLKLHPASTNDSNKILKLLCPETCYYLDITPPETIEEVKTYLRCEQGQQWNRLAIHHPKHGLIGLIGYQIYNMGHRLIARLSYWIGQCWRGNGFAKQALNLLFNFLKNNNIYHYQALTFNNNKLSQKLLLSLKFHICKPAQSSDPESLITFERSDD